MQVMSGEDIGHGKSPKAKWHIAKGQRGVAVLIGRRIAWVGFWGGERYGSREAGPPGRQEPANATCTRRQAQASHACALVGGLVRFRTALLRRRRWWWGSLCTDCA